MMLIDVEQCWTKVFCLSITLYVKKKIARKKFLIKQVMEKKIITNPVLQYVNGDRLSLLTMDSFTLYK